MDGTSDSLDSLITTKYIGIEVLTNLSFHLNKNFI